MLTHDFFFSILLPRLSSSCSLFFDPRPLIISLSLCCEVVGKARLFASFIIIVRSFNRPHLQSNPEAGIDSASTPPTCNLAPSATVSRSPLPILVSPDSAVSVLLQRRPVPSSWLLCCPPIHTQPPVGSLFGLRFGLVHPVLSAPAAIESLNVRFAHAEFLDSVLLWNCANSCQIHLYEI